MKSFDAYVGKFITAIKSVNDEKHDMLLIKM